MAEVVVALAKVPAPVAGVVVQEETLTPLLAGSLSTVAVTGNVVPASTAVLGTVSVTTMAAKVTVVEPVFVESEAEVAVMVTVTSLAGGVAGGV